MRPTLALVTALACLPLCASFPAVQTFAFRAEKGAAVEKTYEMGLTLDLDELAISVGGEEVPAEELGAPEMSMVQASKLVFLDTYPEGAEGPPKLLHRKFVSLANEERQTMGGDGESESETKTEKSDLEGRTVAFVWDADAAEYTARYEGEGADEALLADLIEDCDLRGLLPAGDVAEGESWELDPEVFDLLTGPGGDVGLVDPNDEEEDDSDLDEQFRDNTEGELKATFKELREVDGIRVAVLVIEGSAKTHASKKGSEGEGHAGTNGYELEFADVEGEVLWNAKAGRAHSYQLTAKVQAKITEDATLEFDGQSIEMSQRMTLVGEMRASGKFEVAK
jgi:hypothetical protein